MDPKSSIIPPEFIMYQDELDASEIEELKNRLALQSRSNKGRFRLFTDIILEYIGSGEWHNRTDGFLAICAKSAFLRGMYGYNQVLARGCNNLPCKGYAAAAYCRQSLNPRWVNNLRNYVNQAWQEKNFVVFAELSGQLASVLVDIGYTDRAREVAEESIDRVTKLTAKDEHIRNKVQAALLRARIILAYTTHIGGNRDEALIRLDSADDTARVLDHQLAMADIDYYRARHLEQALEHKQAMSLVKSVHRRYESMGYLHGISEARNLWGVISINSGQLQDARDQFEELLLIQQQLNNQIGLAKTLINVGEIDRLLGQIDQMETYNHRALEISQDAEYVRGIAAAKLNLGDVAVIKGDLPKALEFYDEVLELSEAYGMKDIHYVTLFQAGDTRFLAQEYALALTLYRKATEVSKESGAPHFAFLSAISEIITQWASNTAPDSETINLIRKKLGDLSNWETVSDSEPMRDLRQRIFGDIRIQSDSCVFYHGEMNFECRVERTSLKKECMANLFWMGSLCPHFKEFISRLSE